MRPAVSVLGVLLLLPAARTATAQVGASVQIGVVTMSDLVRDSILAPLAISPAAAPTLAVRLTGALADGWRVGALGQVSRGKVDLIEAGVADSLTTLTVWHAGILLERRITDRVSAEGSVGMLFYAPSRTRATLFQDGTPRPLVWGLGVGYAVPVAGRIRLGLHARYDAHRFNTPRLRTQGFNEDRVIHRFAFTVSVARHHADGSP